MLDKTCYLCKHWNDGYCRIKNKKTDSTDSCSGFITIPCCQDCKHWTRDYDDYSIGKCSIYAGNTPYDSICKADYYKSKSKKSNSSVSASSSTYKSTSNNSNTPYTSDNSSGGKGCLIFIAIVAAIAIAFFTFFRYERKPRVSNPSYSEEYMFPSDTVLLTESDLTGKTKDELALMRNEIYARKGYIFKSEPYKSYFAAKSWYKPNSNFSPSLLNPTEQKNLSLISKFEKNK